MADASAYGQLGMNMIDPEAIALLEELAPRTHWLSLDSVLRLKAPEEPRAILRELLSLYRRGLCEPVHFFPKAAWAYCDNGESTSKAEQAWRVTKDRPYAEGSDAAYRLALRGRAEPLNDEFFVLAQAVFGPLLAHTDEQA